MLTVLVKQRIWTQNLQQSNKLAAQLEEKIEKDIMLWLFWSKLTSAVLTSSKSTRLLFCCCIEWKKLLVSTSKKLASRRRCGTMNSRLNRIMGRDRPCDGQLIYFSEYRQEPQRKMPFALLHRGQNYICADYPRVVSCNFEI